MDIEGLGRIERDIRKAAISLGREEARFLVDAYYQMQENRKRAANQVRALSEADEPHAVLLWMQENAQTLENSAKSALDVYSKASPLGQWARRQKGIGPVIAAGLLAHIDITKAETAGAIWRFAGMDPSMEWHSAATAQRIVQDLVHGKIVAPKEFQALAEFLAINPEVLAKRLLDKEGKKLVATKKNLIAAVSKRPWNGKLKTLCWKIGESFVKVSGYEDAFYGQWYLERKAYEQGRNERGELADEAAKVLARTPKHAQAAIYKTGKLPDGHIHERAKRWTEKLFLAHYFEEGRKLAGLPVPMPYPIAHMGHAHKIEPPA